MLISLASKLQQCGSLIKKQQIITIKIKGKVLISELSGSESLIHFTRGNLNWVSLSNGVFQKDVGDEMNLYMNADEFIYFDENERLVTNG